MISAETLLQINLTDYLWVVFALFWLVAVGISVALFFHWLNYKQISTFGFRTAQLVYLCGLVFLFFLSFFFFINI